MTVLSKLRGEPRIRQEQEYASGPSRGTTATGSTSVTREIVSGSPPDGWVVDIPSEASSRPRTRHYRKPWLDLRNFFVYIEERRRRIRLFFIRKRQPQEVSPSKGGDTQLHVSQYPMRLDIDTLKDDVETTNNILKGPSQVNDAVIVGGTQAQDIGESKEKLPVIPAAGRGQVTALMTERIPRHITGPSGGRLSIELSQPGELSSTAAVRASDLHQDSLESRSDAAHGSSRSTVAASSNYSETERVLNGWIPPDAPPDCAEFTSSAAMVRQPDGTMKAVKVFYDSGSGENWASEGFVRFIGLVPRPILEADLDVYETLKGAFIPSHYVEMELQDESKGMKGFDKMTLNVTPYMDGIGLIAGRTFINKHKIALTAGKGRDGFVTTRRKLNAAEIMAHKRLMKQAEEEAIWAQELVSTAGSTSQPTGTSFQGEQATGSSQTSASSEIKPKDSKA